MSDCLKPMDAETAGHRKQQFGTEDYFSVIIIFMVSRIYNEL